MSSHTAVGGRVDTRAARILLVFALLGLAAVVWRFAAGLGPTTGLSNGYPFGIWIAFDVVTGTALACGGYAVAILVYVLNKGRYHPLVRPAILTSALGYTLGGIAVAVDVGRPWWIWKVPLFFWRWNPNSALLEVALCIMAYILVLWVELSPAFLETWETSDEHPKLAGFAKKARPIVEKALLWVIALGLVLPSMHQSSLGTVMLISGWKLHALWNTPMIPLLFLIGCIAMGYGVVAMESLLSSRVFGRKQETAMLGSLAGAAAITLLIWLAVRLIDVVVRGVLPTAFEASSYAFWFWLEIALAVWPLLLLASKARRAKPGVLFQAALWMVVGGALFRFNTYLSAFNPGDNWSYVPTIPELFVTLGFVAAEILGYLWVVKRFPILSGEPASGRRTRSGGSTRPAPART